MMASADKSPSATLNEEDEVFGDPRWDALASGEATPQQVDELRAWAERSPIANDAWHAFQPIAKERVNTLANNVMGELTSRRLKDEEMKTTTPHVVQELLGGKYRLRKLIVQGGHTEMWDAEDVVSGRPVAIKKYNDLVHADKFAHRAFKYEAMILRGLVHPNIVELLDVGATEQRGPYLVMEHWGGATLRGLSNAEEREWPLDLSLATRIASDIASALVAVHEAKLIHCAIKASNIALHQESVVPVKLTGFEHCQRIGPRAGEGNQRQLGGDYRSPESVVGGELDERHDIWCVGVILYEMLTGRNPHSGGLLHQDLQILNVPVPPPSSVRPGVPPELDDIVLRCLKINREERIASAAELLELLNAAKAQLTAMNETIPPKVDDFFDPPRSPDVMSYRLHALPSAVTIPLDTQTPNQAHAAGVTESTPDPAPPHQRIGRLRSPMVAALVAVTIPIIVAVVVDGLPIVVRCILVGLAVATLLLLTYRSRKVP